MAGTTTTGIDVFGLAGGLRDLVVNYNKSRTDKTTACIMAPAPVIKTGGSTLAKTGATATIAVVGGVMVNIAASTDLGSLTGITITAAKYNIILWTCDSSGATTANAGTEASTLAGVVLPNINSAVAVVAGAYITYASTFTGGTTALDTATTVYFSTVGFQYTADTAAKIGNGNAVITA